MALWYEAQSNREFLHITFSLLPTGSHVGKKIEPTPQRLSFGMNYITIIINNNYY